MSENIDKTEPTIIKNTSQAYGYKFSSLADISRAGVEIPQMRVKPTELGDYIEYLDKNGDWQIGAKIVVPEMKGCNSAQAYGSALTYARRYTTQLARKLACDDDVKVEKQKPTSNTQTKSAKPVSKIDFEKVNEIKKKLPTISSVDELEQYWKELNLDFQYKRILTRRFQERKKELVTPIEVGADE